MNAKAAAALKPTLETGTQESRSMTADHLQGIEKFEADLICRGPHDLRVVAKNHAAKIALEPNGGRPWDSFYWFSANWWD